tara:strand:- start:207 stop:935 length:729 start_codon:yes stop_codon:yes gene_type:complete
MIQKLNVTWFDFETTGLNINKDSPVSIYAINYKNKITIDTILNPEQEIASGASEVHGLYKEDVEDAFKFIDIIPSLSNLINSSEFIGGYNICKYDVPLLISMYKRNNVKLDIKSAKFVDLFHIIKKVVPQDDLDSLEKLNLSSVYKLLTNKELDAHKAKYDTLACVEMLSVLNKKNLPWQDHILNYQDLKGSEITEGDFIMKSGKHEGSSISYLIKKHSAYLKYMITRKYIKLSSELCAMLK